MGAAIEIAWLYSLRTKNNGRLTRNRRSLVETAMYHYKTVVGRRLRARILPNQRTETKIGCNLLNRMTTLGMPATVRIR
jgi:hypothetical protein